jgi:hypothetical protein
LAVASAAAGALAERLATQFACSAAAAVTEGADLLAAISVGGRVGYERWGRETT